MTYHYKDNYEEEAEKESCLSCDKEFIAEDNNDRPEGWFCNKCLDNEG